MAIWPIRPTSFSSNAQITPCCPYLIFRAFISWSFFEECALWHPVHVPPLGSVAVVCWDPCRHSAGGWEHKPRCGDSLAHSCVPHVWSGQCREWIIALPGVSVSHVFFPTQKGKLDAIMWLKWAISQETGLNIQTRCKHGICDFSFLEKALGKKQYIYTVWQCCWCFC